MNKIEIDYECNDEDSVVTCTKSIEVVFHYSSLCFVEQHFGGSLIIT